MAREYGKVMMSAWVDSDFTSLSRRAQGTYFFIVSQPDLNRAGVLTMALNRWASRSAENDRAMILADLGELARARFIVVDESQEEVLVRSYVRWDEGWKSPNIMLSVSSAARQVTSETLRAVIAEEVARIDTSGLSDKVNDRTGRSTREFVEQQIDALTRNLSGCEKDPFVTSWGNPSAKGSGKGSPKGSVERSREGFAEGFPEGSLTTTTPATTPTTTTTTATTPSKSDPFDDFWAAYPKRKDKGHARTAWAKAVRKADPETITAAAARFAADPHLPEPQFVPLAATWLNGERWEDGPCVPRTSGTTDRQADILRAEMVKAKAADAQGLLMQRMEITR